MSRPTKLVIDPNALLHNLEQIKRFAPDKKIFAMVKANAYGCGVSRVAPVLDGKVDAFGVACLEEALTIRALGCQTQCILFHGVFHPTELAVAVENDFAAVIHNAQQLQWILNSPLKKPLALWVKVNTGMHRLGFKPEELPEVVNALSSCSWVKKDLGLMTHLACADQPERIENRKQIEAFQKISITEFTQKSLANSACLVAFPETHAHAVRPGIMLYGVSPFANKTAHDLGLMPVMRFISKVTTIHKNPPMAQVGYGGDWHSSKASVIGIVPVGYGDGYPRHIGINTPVWVKGKEVPIVGRISMDMLAIDLTSHQSVSIGEEVELWGSKILVERIAASAGTIAYELLCQVTDRTRK